MKNAIVLAMLAIAIGFTASAQEKMVTKKTKIEKTATPKQRVHNVIHPHHKHYSGYKVKHEKKVTHIK